MKVQVFLEAGIPPGDVADLSALADSFGIDTLWASSFPARREPFMCLSAAATQTSNIRLGPVPISPYELHPLKIADALLTLNELSNGRAAITVGGLGHSVMRVTGLRPDRRVRAVQECVEIIRAAASGEFVDYVGEIYQLQNYQADWLEAKAPLIYVGANGPMMLSMAGRVADGIMLSDVPLARMAEVLNSAAAGRQSGERAGEPLFISNFFAWHIKADREAAEAEARMELIWRGLLQPWHTSPFLGDADAALVDDKRDAFLQAFLTRSPNIAGVPEHIVAALVDNLTFTGGFGDIEVVVDKLRQLGQAGQNGVTLKVHGDAREAIQTIGEHLLPAL